MFNCAPKMPEWFLKLEARYSQAMGSTDSWDFNNALCSPAETARFIMVVKVAMEMAHRGKDLIRQLKDQNCILPAEIDGFEESLDRFTSELSK